MKATSIYLTVLLHLPFIARSQVYTIDNIQTSEHVEIPGTKYIIIKPDRSFYVAQDYTGLQSADMEAGINITELPMPFDDVLNIFSKDIPSKNGKLIFEKDYLMNEHRVKLYKTEVIHKSAIEKLSNPDAEGDPKILWLMIYGDETLCITISATYPSSIDSALSDKFNNSLLSFLYLKDKDVDPLDGLTFSINTENTPLRFASVLMQTGAAFNIDGKFPTQSPDRTTYMILVMPFEVELDEQREKAIRTVRKPSRENIEIKEVNPVSIDGLNGYEVVGYERNENEELTMNYSVTLFDSKRHFIINGMSKIEVEDRLEMFRRISRTFQLRE
jgi:hypothetical protein